MIKSSSNKFLAIRPKALTIKRKRRKKGKTILKRFALYANAINGL